MSSNEHMIMNGDFLNFYGWTITSSGGGLAWYRGGSDYVNGFVGFGSISCKAYILFKF